jgi:VanZ family protein
VVSKNWLRRLAQIGTVAAAAVTLYLTLTPSPPDSPLPPWLGHFLMFAVLGATVALWYATSDIATRSPRRALLMILFGLWIFAAATEIAQGVITGREPHIEDWFANMTGGLTGLFVGSAIWRLIIERRLS